MLPITLKNTRQGSLPGNGYEGRIVAFKHPSPGSFIMNKKHGLRHHKCYDVWKNIRRRCTVPTCDSYKNYGGRGIKMCDEWLNDVKAFIDYASTLLNYGEPGYTIDRTDNDGDYEPGNLRWTTRHEQSVNRRRVDDLASGYMGVSKVNNRYRARLLYKMKGIHLGYFDSAKEAAIARNEYVIENKLEDWYLNSIDEGIDKI